MGLIMLILVGIVPTAYALNHALPASETQDFVAVSRQTANLLDKYVQRSAVGSDPQQDVEEYVRNRTFTPTTMLGLRQLVNERGRRKYVRDSRQGTAESRAQLPQ
jgi:PiT family inorganic phosphate transporter